MPAHPHVARRSPEFPGDFCGGEGLRVGQGQNLAVLLSELVEGAADRGAPLLRQEGAEGVVRGGFGRRGSEAPQRLDLPAGRPVPALADVKGRLEEEGGKRGGLLDAAGLQRLDRAADGLLGDVFRVGEAPEPACGEIEKTFPERLDLTGHPIGFARGRRGGTALSVVPHCGLMLTEEPRRFPRNG
jgi:hypothetical protein